MKLKILNYHLCKSMVKKMPDYLINNKKFKILIPTSYSAEIYRRQRFSFLIRKKNGF